MNLSLTSCMYYNLDSEFNGRICREPHYHSSFKNILSNRIDTHLYTADALIPTLSNIYKDDTNLKIHKSELKELPVYNDIKELKAVNSLVQYRCYEIMYSKLYWVEQTIKNTDNEFYFWVDAGLSHCGIFPNWMLKNPETTNHAEKFYYYDILSENFFNKITKDLNDKIWVCIFDQRHRPWEGVAPQAYFDIHPIKPEHMVGGIFGGRKESMLWFISEFNNRLYNRFIKDKFLMPEEHIYTTITNDFDDRFKKNFFNSWYASDQGELYRGWTENMPFVNEFYKIFEK
jgi:hypothetical protein